METKDESGFRPPYMSFQTFWSFVGELASKPLPPQIDRSMMDTKSGGDQANILGALKGFRLIADNNAVTAGLERLVVLDAGARKDALASTLREYYPNQIAVSEQNGTEKLLLDSFETDFGYAGDTRRKAMTFFLHAARHAGIQLSPHFPQTRSGSGSGPRPKRTTSKRKNGGGGEDMKKVVPHEGDTYTVTLPESGTVLTLTVKSNAFALSKSKSDRDFVFGIVDTLTGWALSGDEEDEP